MQPHNKCPLLSTRYSPRGDCRKGPYLAGPIVWRCRHCNSIAITILTTVLSDSNTERLDANATFVNNIFDIIILIIGPMMRRTSWSVYFQAVSCADRCAAGAEDDTNTVVGIHGRLFV